MAGEAERIIEKIGARLEQLNKLAKMWRGDPTYLETLAIDIAGVESLLNLARAWRGDPKYIETLISRESKNE